MVINHLDKLFVTNVEFGQHGNLYLEAIANVEMDGVVDRMEDGQGKDKLQRAAEDAKAAFTAVEEALYQTKSKSRQDPLNFPIKLTDKLLGVLSATNRAEFGPTRGQREVAAQLSEAIRRELAKFGDARSDHVAKFNAMARDLAAPHIK